MTERTSRGPEHWGIRPPAGPWDEVHRTMVAAALTGATAWSDVVADGATLSPSEAADYAVRAADEVVALLIERAKGGATDAS